MIQNPEPDHAPSGLRLSRTRPARRDGRYPRVAALGLVALAAGCRDRGSGPTGAVVLTYNPFGEPITLADEYEALLKDEDTSKSYCSGVVPLRRTETLSRLIEAGEPTPVGSPLSMGSLVTAILYFPDRTRVMIRQNREVIDRSGVVFRESEDEIMRIERQLVELAIEGGCEVYEQDLRDYLKILPE